MFEAITKAMLARMAYLEEIDERDRTDGTERLSRLRQIPPETGRFLCLLAANCPSGDFIEIGTSAGYSTMWLSLAVREKGIKLKTFEILEEKIALAKETFRKAEIEDYVELFQGDARENVSRAKDIAFCFLDCEKEFYLDCWDLFSSKVVKGGLFIADNALSHHEELKPALDKIMDDARFDSMIVPIGKGELVCRRK